MLKAKTHRTEPARNRATGDAPEAMALAELLRGALGRRIPRAMFAEVFGIPTPSKMELGEGGDPSNFIYGSILPFYGED